MQPAHGPQRSNDAHLFDEVCARLLNEDHLAPCDIQVRVKDCVVQLSGWVQTVHAKRLAIETALTVPGVVSILDQIRVQMLTNSSDRSHNAGN